jgi:RimJ/RimL family protein N-acetyltransferase
MYQHKNKTVFRKVEKGDLKALLELKQESWWGVHSNLVLNQTDQERWFESMPDNMLCMIIKYPTPYLPNGSRSTFDVLTPVGVMILDHIDWISRRASISGSIYKSYRGRQYTKSIFEAGLDFAFEFLNLHRLDAEVLETNVKAQYLEIDHLGFKVEGTRRQAVYKCGNYYDSIILGMLREEWEQQDRVKAYNGCCNIDWELSQAIKRIS